MTIKRLRPDGFWPSPDVQRGWWQGLYVGLGRLHFKFSWHREASNQDSERDK